MNIIDKIVQKVDLVDYIGKLVPLRKAGKTFRGSCPIHSGKNESSLNVGDKLYYCFSCNSGGTVVNFVADYYKIDYSSAVERLADEFNIDISNDAEWKKQKDIVKMMTDVRDSAIKFKDKIKQYLMDERKLSAGTIDSFKLGYNNDLALIIPLHDPNDRCIAIAKRLFGSEHSGKYINSYNNDLYDKSAYLYNLNRARRVISQEIYMVEGYFDTMSADEQGLCCVGYCGDAPTLEQMHLLKKYIPSSTIEIKWCPDNDVAGLKNIRKVRDMFQQVLPSTSIRIVLLPDGYKDFNDVHKAGLQIKDLVTEHVDMYLTKKYLSECSSVETQYTAIGEFIRTIPNSMIRVDIAKYCAGIWKQKEQDVKKYFEVLEQNTDEISQEFKTVEDALNNYKEILEHGTISIGFPTLDMSINGGMRKGEVLIVGAYSGTGKTFLTCEMCLHAALRQGLNCLFFSLEMSSGALIERMASAILGISTTEFEKKVKEGELDTLLPQITGGVGRRVCIDDRSGITIDDINKRIKLANATFFDRPVDVIFIDYIQLMKNTTTTEQISESVLKLKDIAKENNILLVAISQLNRESELWIKPELKMLKGSSSIEQTADLVLMAYKPCENPALPLAKVLELDGVLSLSIEKFRRKLKIKGLDVRLDEKTTRFTEVGVK